MTNPDYTHLLVITDRSGSMSGLEKEMIGALNTLFDEQAKLDGECLVDYVQFDNVHDLVFTDRPVAEARAVLEPRGSTALLDAVGRACTTFGAKLASKPESERPGIVVVIVITDGWENASQEWTAEKVRELIKTQEDEFSWNFTFLGANLDAVAVGASFGFNPAHSLTYSTGNTAAMASSAHTHTMNIRAGNIKGYSDEDRSAQGV